MQRLSWHIQLMLLRPMCSSQMKGNVWHVLCRFLRLHEVEAKQFWFRTFGNIWLINIWFQFKQKIIHFQFRHVAIFVVVVGQFNVIFYHFHYTHLYWFQQTIYILLIVFFRLHCKQFPNILQWGQNFHILCLQIQNK